MGLLELLLDALAGFDGVTQLGLQGFDSLAGGSVAVAFHKQVVSPQLREGNALTVIANVRLQLAAPDAGANRLSREASELRRLSHVNRWGS